MNGTMIKCERVIMTESDDGVRWCYVQWQWVVTVSVFFRISVAEIRRAAYREPRSIHDRWAGPKRDELPRGGRTFPQSQRDGRN